jgi:hypothetical protein
MTKLDGTRMPKGWVDTKRADGKLRRFDAKPAVDVARLGVQLGPSQPKPGSRLKAEPKGKAK